MARIVKPEEFANLSECQALAEVEDIELEYVIDDFDAAYGFYALDMDGDIAEDKAKIRTFVEKLESEEPDLSYDEMCNRIKAEFGINEAA
ncbi:MAG: hypothetical protein PHO05_07840 [bacterium]|nr:hypothetical protein [bacterium]